MRLSSLVKDLQARCNEYTKDKNRIKTLIKNQFSALETKLSTQIQEKINTSTQDESKSTKESKKSFAEAASEEKNLNIHSVKQIIPIIRREKIKEHVLYMMSILPRNLLVVFEKITRRL